MPDVLAAVCAGERDTSLAFEMVRWHGAIPTSRTWTREELARAVRRAAGAIADVSEPGDRVVVALPPGLEFVATFLGCLGSGRLAVPTQTPTTTRTRDFVRNIVAATGARAVLTEAFPPDAPERDLISPAPGADAYIQFTSGSTQAPRGAVITHGALAANLAAIGEAWRLTPRDQGVFWLPPFHDMGLVGALLAPIAFGFPATLMHPAAFLQRPARWLELIAERRATFSGAPNFAYDLCVERVDETARARFDLSSWRVAVNGAEPVSAATLRRFADAFAPCGFAPDALAPGYGLAESVLFVTAGRSGASHAAHNPKPGSPVSCGPPGRHVTVRIVDESRGDCVADGEVGAIWVAGPSLARGYWNSPTETAANFAAHLPGDHRHYLRTGDLGFLRRGELHVCGRAKDLIIRGGRKAHAADIEHAIARDIGGGGGARRTAVFACNNADGGERLVVVHEINGDGERRLAHDAITDALGSAFDLIADDIVFTPRGGVRVTSSGKVARGATRDAYLAGALALVPASPQAAQEF